jgi:hypothetical protein
MLSWLTRTHCLFEYEIEKIRYLMKVKKNNDVTAIIVLYCLL